MADEENNEEVKAAPAAAAAPKAQGKNPFVALLLIANLAIMSAVAYFQYMAAQKDAARPSIRDIVKAEMGEPGTEGENVEAIEESKGKLFPLQGFTSNLAQGKGPRRFLRMSAVLKFSDDSKEDEYKNRNPQIRDTIISLLNSKRPEDLIKREGKEYLKEEIKQAINAFMIDGKVEDIFYVKFQIN